MKQLLQNLKTGETLVAEVPCPTPQAGEALVRNSVSIVSAGTERMLVEFAGKSLVGKARSRPDLVRQVLDKARREGLLTTMEAAFNRLDQPMPLGYSSAGVVAALGCNMEGFQVGQRVACAGGGYAVHAEYVCVPRSLLSPLPESVNFEAAAFTTLGAIAMHGYRLGETQLGERVAVIGLGLLGLLTVGIALAAGCRVLGVDLDPKRVDLGRIMGGEAVLRSEAEDTALSFSRGRGCDAVFICADSTSNDPVELAGAIARDRARVIAVGAVGQKLPRGKYFEKELVFINSRSYGPGRYDPSYEEGGVDYPIGYVRWTEGRNMEAFIDLLEGKRLDVSRLVSHRFPIQQANQAYDLITGKTDQPFLGVLLTYDSEQNDQRDGKDIEGRTLTSLPTRTRVSRSPDFGKVRLGVLGAGSFATAVMLPALKKIPEIELVGIASPSGVSAQHAANRYSFRYASSLEQKLIEDPQINTIAILTRHHLHAPLALAALRAGKHVFCEKPLAINLEELEELEQTVRAGADDVIIDRDAPLLTAGFNRRFAPLAQKLVAFLADRTEPLQAHYRVNAGFIPPNHWLHDPKQGGGRIIGEGCHFIDFLTFMVGAQPVSVSTQSLPDLGRYREDNVLMTFLFSDGSIGSVSYLANGPKPFPKERVEVFSSGKAAVLDDFRSLEMVTGERRVVLRSRLRQDKGHLAEWQAFTAAIRDRSGPTIPYPHLFGVTKAALAAVESLRTGAAISLDSGQS
jgi:predicted dehydrogenase/threonine dehydrogenase-like Zn-dependent dehydrogenase